MEDLVRWWRRRFEKGSMVPRLNGAVEIKNDAEEMEEPEREG